MDTKLAQEFKTSLEKIKEDLEKQIKELGSAVEYGSDVDHFDEEADEAEEIGNRIGVSQALKERLNNINVALEKISKEKYGACENCGNKISVEILKAEPDSRLCKECKGLIEKTS